MVMRAAPGALQTLFSRWRDRSVGMLSPRRVESDAIAAKRTARQGPYPFPQAATANYVAVAVLQMVLHGAMKINGEPTAIAGGGVGAGRRWFRTDICQLVDVDFWLG